MVGWEGGLGDGGKGNEYTRAKDGENGMEWKAMKRGGIVSKRSLGGEQARLEV